MIEAHFALLPFTLRYTVVSPQPAGSSYYTLIYTRVPVAHARQRFENSVFDRDLKWGEARLCGEKVVVATSHLEVRLVCVACWMWRVR